MNKAILAAAAACMTGVASATTNEVSVLEPVTVYASRIDDTRDMMASPVIVFDAEAIAASGARDFPELLKKKCGIEVRSLNGNPTLAQIAMRGFGENSFGRTKVVIDGEELNNVDMNPPNLTRIPLGSIRRIEVIHGPCPVLYGDGAVAGLVNVMTDAEDRETKTRIAGVAGSQNTFGANFQTKGALAEDGLIYGASYDYVQSDGYRRRSAYRLHSMNAGLRQNFENGSTIGFKVNYQNGLYELPGSLSYDQWRHERKSSGLTTDDSTRHWGGGVSVDSKMLLAEDQWLRVDGSFSRQFRNNRSPSSIKDLEYDYYSYQLSPRYINEKDVFDHGNKFTVGLDFRFDRYNENHSKYYGMPPIKRHFWRERYAAFVYDEFFITETLSVIAGARLERIGNRWSNYGGLAEDSSRDWMGDFELGLVYRPIEGLKTYMKGTRFHRSAFCDELSYTKDGRFLEPEKGVSFDIGAEWELSKEFLIYVNGYASVMEDEIFYNPYITQMPWGWNGYNSNSPSKTRRVGFDTGFSWKRDKFAEASLRYSLVHADFSNGQYKGKDIPYVPNHKIRAEVGYWLFDDLEIKGGYYFVSRQYLAEDFNNEAKRLPSYSLFDVGIYYTPSWAEGWKASFVIDNLLDRNYCDYAFWGGTVGYYYPACGRSFLFTLSYEF